MPFRQRWEALPMVAAEKYLKLVKDRLTDDGATTSEANVGGFSAVVGYRAQFRLRWLATRVHLFTVVASVPYVNSQRLQQFTNDVLDFGVKERGRFRGLQTGVGVIAALVSESVETEARMWATTDLVDRRGAFAWPALVDLSSGRISFHVGAVTRGGLYASWMRQQIETALPVPPD